jgi:hypothetical protein
MRAISAVRNFIARKLTQNDEFHDFINKKAPVSGGFHWVKWDSNDA